MAKYKLMEVCLNQDCTEFGGGWQVKKSNSKSDLQNLLTSNKPGDCPGCGDQLIFEIWEDPEEVSLFKDIKNRVLEAIEYE